MEKFATSADSPPRKSLVRLETAIVSPNDSMTKHGSTREIADVNPQRTQIYDLGPLFKTYDRGRT